MSKVKRSEERLRFDKCLGRVLAEDVVSDVFVPPFSRAAMDGYAIMGKDSFGASQTNPVRLKVVETTSISEGEVKKIMTGEKIPDGSDAVVMFEYVHECDGEIEVFHPVTPGKNVSMRGEDVRKGEVVLRNGRVLRSCDVGILAAIGKTYVRVLKLPRVAIISTGDELAEPGKAVAGKTVDVNSYTLAAMVSGLGIPQRFGTVGDDAREIKGVIKKTLEHDIDLILISGGSSMGRKDLIPGIVEEMGVLLFHWVSLHPGGPTGFGLILDRIDEKPIFILPGFPVAAMVAFEILVRPFLQEMQGLQSSSCYPRKRMILRRKVASELGRFDFVRVRFMEDGGLTYADPVEGGSSVISSLVKADGFLLIPENKEGMEKGEVVTVNVLDPKYGS